jgi:hypothetical protein
MRHTVVKPEVGIKYIVRSGASRDSGGGGGGGSYDSGGGGGGGSCEN